MQHERRNCCTAWPVLTNLQNFLTLFPWEHHLYHWRMRIFVACSCGHGSRVDEITGGKCTPGDGIYGVRFTIADPWLGIMIIFNSSKLIKMEKTRFFSFFWKKYSIFICCMCPQRSFLSCFCIMLTHKGTGMRHSPIMHPVAIPFRWCMSRSFYQCYLLCEHHRGTDL